MSPLLLPLSELTGCYSEPEDTQRLAAIEERLDALEAAATTSGDTAGSPSEDLGGELAALDERLTAIEDDYLASGSLADVVRLISEDTEYTVSTAADLVDTLAWLQGYRIAPDASVTLNLTSDDSDEWEFDEPLLIDHPDGARLQIVGDETNPASIAFQFTGTDGVRIGDHRALGLLSGVTILGDRSGGTNGLEVGENALAGLGYLTIQYFDTGLLVRPGGMAGASDDVTELEYPEGWLVSSDNTTYGIRVQEQGYARVAGAEVASNGALGVFVEHGVVLLNEAELHDNGSMGLYADFGSYVDARDAEAKDNGSHGLAASGGSALAASGATASYNAGTGFNCNAGAVLLARGTDAESNGDRTDAAATGSGFRAESCFLDMGDATSAGNEYSGVLVEQNGWVYAAGATLNDEEPVISRDHADDDHVLGM